MSAFDHVEIFVGDDGDGYYTVVYQNGEPGPRSEGYRGQDPGGALAAATQAAKRDFPDLPIEYRNES